MNTKHSTYSISPYLLYASIVLVASSSVMVDSVIARIEDQLIMQSELEAAYQQHRAQANSQEPDLKESQGPDLKEKILQQMITNKIMAVCARQEDIKVTRAELDDETDRRIQYMLMQAGSKERLEQYFGKSLPNIRMELREHLREQLLLEKLQHKITGAITVTPAEVKAFFDAYPTNKLPYYPAQVVIRQIVKYPQTTEEMISARAALHQLRQSILEGTLTFQQAVQQASEDPRAAANEGLLTDADGHTRIAESNLPYDVYMAIESLSPGDISTPTTFTPAERRQGVRILLLEKKMAAHQACLEHDYAALQHMALKMKQQDALQQWLQEAQQKITITVAPAYKHCAPHNP